MTRPLKENGVSTEVLDRIAQHKREALDRCRQRGRLDEHAARALGMRHMEQDPDKVQRYVYPCKTCGGWHVTKQQQPPYFAADYFLRADSPQRRTSAGTVRCPDCGEPGLQWHGVSNTAYLYSPSHGRHYCHKV